jgi:hypothetical protein
MFYKTETGGRLESAWLEWERCCKSFDSLRRWLENVAPCPVEALEEIMR